MWVILSVRLRKTGGMSLTVWVDSWQQECCGTPFAIGSEVTWTLTDATGRDLDLLFASSERIVVDGVEDHHGYAPDDAPVTVAAVTTIRAVQLRYTAADEERAHRAVPGSARLIALHRSDGEEMRAAGFAGYVVEIVVTG
jgi:hypothetical protein